MECSVGSFFYSEPKNNIYVSLKLKEHFFWERGKKYHLAFVLFAISKAPRTRTPTFHTSLRIEKVTYGTVHIYTLFHPPHITSVLPVNNGIATWPTRTTT